MSYQVLARKYRPQKFSEVIGQEHVTRTLKNALEQGRTAHGYIFSGHRGIGKTTVARILAMIANEVITVDAVYSEVRDKLCSGCRICNTVCPYSAIEYDAEKKKSKIISEICKACGCCAAACPSGVINARHFTDEQIFAQIEALL